MTLTESPNVESDATATRSQGPESARCSPNAAPESLTKRAQERPSGARLDSLILLNSSATFTFCPDGYKPKPEDIPYPRPNTWLEEALAITVTLSLFSFAVLLPSILWVCIAATVFYRSVTAALFLILVTADCLLPAGEVWPAFRDAYVWDVLRRYFRLRHITPSLPYLDTSKPMLAAQFPHAVFSMGFMLTPPIYGLPGTGTPKGGLGVIANFLLILPFYKHIFAWMGGHPIDAATFRSLLQRKALAMQPEGLAGLTNGATPSREALYISKRRGFIRIAIQTGAPIVPVYHLGQSQLLSFWGPASIIRKMRTPVLGFLWGRWLLPLPRKHDIITVGARPIEVKQCDNPTEEEADKVHALLVEAIVQLYKRYRHLIPGWESRPLIIE